MDVPHNQTVSIGSVARFTCRATVEPGWRIKVPDSGVFASYREFAGIFNDKGILVDDSVSEHCPRHCWWMQRRRTTVLSSSAPPLLQALDRLSE